MKKFMIMSILLMLLSPLGYAYNPQQLKQLRETCSCPGCDLSNANLSNFKLGDNRTLNPQKAKTDTNGLIVCNISNANFSGANLQNSFFSPSDFAPDINDKVGKIEMKGVNFTRANLAGAHLNAVNADGSNFTNANLKDASIMKSASFKNCNFSAAQMTHVSVSPPMGGCGADFTESNFSQANLSNCKLIANFSGANFTYANLTYAKLLPCDTDPQNAFDKTNFFGTNLMKASYDNKDLTENLLINAKLCHTRLSNSVSNRDCEFFK